MTSYSVRLLKGATRDLERLDNSTGRHITHRISWLSQNMDSVRPVALKGELAGLYKLREGDYRIIYQVLTKEKIIIIHGIGHRKEIYKKMK